MEAESEKPILIPLLSFTLFVHDRLFLTAIIIMTFLVIYKHPQVISRSVKDEKHRSFAINAAVFLIEELNV